MVRWAFLYGMSWARPCLATAIANEALIDQCRCTDTDQCSGYDYAPIRDDAPDLLVTVAWRHLVPPDLLASCRLGVVGFHSARLPEYPGRAPVPWAILRGDTVTAQTMLFLTDEPDAGDVIDSREVPVLESARGINTLMGYAAADMLEHHLPALLLGRAARTPQDRSRRGPLTTANGWQLLPEDRR